MYNKNKHTHLTRRKLGNTSISLPILGFGASPLGGVYGDINELEAIASVHSAIEQGINYFDTSPYYGNTLSEILLGKALSTVPREDFIISTKVGRYGEGHFDFSEPCIIRSIEQSLRYLKVDSIDLCICHDAEFGSLDQIVNETIPALKCLQREGKIKYIGVSGLPLDLFRSFLDRSNHDLDFVLSYCQYTLLNTNLEILWHDFLEKTGIGIINGSPLAMGLLTRQGPPKWHPASKIVKSTCANVAEFCEKQQIDISHLALNYALQGAFITSTLVGMSTRQQVSSNIQAFNQYFPSEIIDYVHDQFKPIRNCLWF